MYKKLYSLLASVLILSACTTDESWVDPQPAKGEEVSVSFILDAPSETISKSSAVPTEGSDPEPWVKNLVLYTFDENKNFIGAVAAQPASAGSNSYTAVIQKATRKIHFVSNYGDTGQVAYIPEMITGATESTMETIRTQEYIYWAKKDFNPAAPSLGTIELVRNWSRLSLTNLSTTASEGLGLTNVSFYVYSNPQYATYAQKTGEAINVASPNQWSRPISEPTEWKTPSENSNFTYLRENDNYQTNATFVIVKGKFLGDNNVYYYKIDISNTDNNGITTLYNIERNKWYQISILRVLQKGVSTWAEVINPDKLPDNNIMAAAQISDYPKVAYEGYTLEVIPKTTYVFTGSTGNQLNFNVEYRNASGGLINNSTDLKLHFTTDISNVVNGNVTMAKPSGVVTANIHNVVPGEIKETEFYIIAGELQRRIKLILRPAYEFMNVNVTPANPTSTDTSVNVHFELPEIDKSLFPLEVAIRTNKLYSVESGVRIETYSNGDYAYIYTVQENDYTSKNGKFNVAFKTNVASVNDYVTINAVNFNEASKPVGNNTNRTFTNVSTSRVGNTVTVKFTTPVYPSPYTVTIAKPSALTGATSYTVTRPGEHSISYTTTTNTGTGSITLSAGGFDNQVIEFTYTGITGTNTIQYGGNSGTSNYVPSGATITTSVPGVSIVVSNRGSGRKLSDGKYTVTIPAGTMMNQPIIIYYRNSSSNRYYQKFTSITDFLNKEIKMTTQQG